MKLIWKPTPLGPMLGHAAHLSKERMDARISCYDVTPAQSHTLLYLCEHDAATLQRNVVEHLRVKPSTVNGILDRMEEKGLIERRILNGNRRSFHIFMTEEGKRKQQLVEKAFEKVEKRALVNISEEEFQNFMAVYGKIYFNLQEKREL